MTKRIFESEDQQIKDDAKALRTKWNKAIEDGLEPDVEELIGGDDLNGAEWEEEEDEEERAEKERVAVLKSYRV